MPSQRNTYRKLDRDTSKNKVSKDSYFDCRNMRVMGDDPNESGGLVNMLGNYLFLNHLSYNSVNYHSDSIIGAKQIRDKVVFFSTPHSTAASSNYGRIWTINLKATSPSPTLLYSGRLGLSTANPMLDDHNIITRYESEDVQNVYWADGYNYLRSCNIAEDLTGKDPDDFNIVSSYTMSTPEFQSISTGAIPVGRVQYAYRLYKKHGNQTAFGPASRLINLTTANEGVSQSYKYKGADRLDENGDAQSSGKSVNMSISDIDTDYDYIEIVAIHYSAVNETPNIYVVDVFPIAEEILFTDPGDYDQGTYTLAEYTALSYLFKPRALATKKNILFAANLIEEEFDVDYDARAFRYRNIPLGNTEAKICDGSGSYYLHYSTGSLLGYGANAPAINSLSDIAEDFDCTNESNDLTLDQAGNRYVYQIDGTTYGGEGVNVSYKFLHSDDLIDTTSSARRFSVNNLGAPNYFSSFASPRKDIGYQRDEIYRFGVVFFNNKGQASPVKWIGDIRMPGHGITLDNPNVHSYTNIGATYKRDLYLEFTVNNIPDEAVGYQIVRVEREAKDRTVLFQSKMGLTRKYNFPYPGAANISLDYTIAESGYATAGNYPSETSVAAQDGKLWLNAPELSIYKNHSVSVGDYIQVVGYYEYENHVDETINYRDADVEVTIACPHRTSKFSVFSKTDNGETGLYRDVDKAWLIESNLSPDDKVESVNYDGLVLSNLTYSETGEIIPQYTLGNAGTGLLLDIASNLDLSSLPANSYPVINYRRKAVQYGGNTFEARTRNEYIPAGEYTLKTASSMTGDVYGGDCYIQFFDNLFSSFNQGYIYENGIYPLAMVDHFPVESTINLDMRHGDFWNNIEPTTFATSYVGLLQLRLDLTMRETSNSVIQWSGIEFSTGWTDYYNYNTVYSRNNNAKPVFAVEEDYEASKENDTKVIASTAKYDEEEVDSWTQFSLNESLMVDGNYGPVNYLVIMNNQLLYFQDTAFGTLAVLDRSLIQDSGGSNLTLGEGEVLQRYDMISADIGCSTRGSMLVTPSFILWFDAKKKRIYRLMKTIENLGVIKGINSYLQNIDEAIISNDNIYGGLYAGLCMAYNPRFHEVWITFKTGYSDGETLVYNEVLDSFTGFIDNEDNMGYLAQDDVLVSHRFLSRLYMENSESVERCSFMGTIYPAYVEAIVNPAETLVYTLTNLELTTEVINDAGDNVLDETITSLRIRNDYQDTGEITLVSGTNIRRLMRTWRINSLRDSAYRARLRDTYMKVKLTHTNQAGSNRKVLLHDLVSIFTMPIESVSNKQ